MKIQIPNAYTTQNSVTPKETNRFGKIITLVSCSLQKHLELTADKLPVVLENPSSKCRTNNPEPNSPQNALQHAVKKERINETNKYTKLTIAHKNKNKN